MLHVLGTKITLQQGDTAMMRISLINSKGVEIPLSASDSLTLHARYKLEADSSLHKKSIPIQVDGSDKVYHVIQFNYSDTRDLLPGDYDYEVVLEYDSNKFTVIPKSVMTIVESLSVLANEEDITILDADTQIDYSDIISCTSLVGVFNGISCDTDLVEISDDLILF